MKLTIEPIGIMHSPFSEKFSVPRQSGLIAGLESQLALCPPYNHRDFIEGIEQFSHLWVIFAFDKNIEGGFKPKVRPPRLGGNQKIGVFASRASFRPNHLGMSAMALKGVSYAESGPILHFYGGDLVSGTPVYDIKPYIPYADSIDDAKAGYAQHMPEAPLKVKWLEPGQTQAKTLNLTPLQCRVIEQVLAQDPRPAYKRNKQDEKHYGVALYNINISWYVRDDVLYITQLTPYATRNM